MKVIIIKKTREKNKDRIQHNIKLKLISPHVGIHFLNCYTN